MWQVLIVLSILLCTPNSGVIHPHSLHVTCNAFPSGRNIPSLAISFKLGHVTGFGQWNISRTETFHIWPWRAMEWFLHHSFTFLPWEWHGWEGLLLQSGSQNEEGMCSQPLTWRRHKPLWLGCWNSGAVYYCRMTQSKLTDTKTEDYFCLNLNIWEFISLWIEL